MLAEDKEKESMEQQRLLLKVAERIKQLRKEKGFSNYEHFANEIGISRTQYGKYETGENLKILTLARILKHLNISWQEFFAEGFDS